LVSDEIVGLSVLQETWVSGVYWLWFTARKGTGETNQGWVFIRDEALPGPDRMPDYPPGHDEVWKFRRYGRRLECRPSVNWVSWGFHNAAAWSMEYVEMVPHAPPPDYDRETPRWWRASAVHYDLNLQCLTDAERALMVSDLRAAGILKVA
jgi:hypothetical protein